MSSFSDALAAISDAPDAAAASGWDAFEGLEGVRIARLAELDLRGSALESLPDTSLPSDGVFPTRANAKGWRGVRLRDFVADPSTATPLVEEELMLLKLLATGVLGVNRLFFELPGVAGTEAEEVDVMEADFDGVGRGTAPDDDLSILVLLGAVVLDPSA